MTNNAAYWPKGIVNFYRSCGAPVNLECKEKVTAAAAAAKLLHSCLTPCDPIDGSPPDSVPGILQAGILE